MGELAGLTRGIAGLSRLGLNALLPPRCLSCGVTVHTPGALCSICWEGMDFLGPPACACCGLPFAYDLGAEALCGACTREPPVYDRARAVLRYDDHSRKLVLGFKYADRTEGAAAYGQWLARAGVELLRDAELIAPVPLHWVRLFTRRYNQAALLAHGLGRHLGRHCTASVVPDLLERRRRTRPQGRLSASARRRNVAGAFTVKPGHAPLVAGRRVLLIDDVLTTGATASACAKALRRGGAAAVDVLVLARVVRGDA